jgi:beta-xylosidase
MLGVLALLAVAGCGDAPVPATATPIAGTAAVPAPGTVAPAPTGTVPTPGAPVPPPAAATFANPVIRADFPDPDVIQVGTTYYAFATGGSGHNIQAATSTDLVSWHLLSDALPGLPRWSDFSTGNTWAPEVLAVGGKYLLYYTALAKAQNKHCIGVAVAAAPSGRFRDTSAQPLICPDDQPDAIDPSPFADGDRLYLYWSTSGPNTATTTAIYGQELAADGLRPLAAPVRLLGNDQPWEDIWVEGPQMVQHAGAYYLFYSGNAYNRPGYAVGYALCQSPTGPCGKAVENPILKTVTTPKPVFAPGGQHIFEAHGQTWIAYHAWTVNPEDVEGSRRPLWIDRLEWRDNKPVPQGPTSGPQPVP